MISYNVESIEKCIIVCNNKNKNKSKSIENIIKHIVEKYGDM